MPKIDPRRLPAFLADPGGCRVVLLHGDDPGLIRERAEALVRSIAEGDALRLVEMPKEALRSPAALANEAASSPLTGGRVLVRVRDAGDGKQITDAAKAALAGKGPGVVVIEAPELRGSAALMKAVEASPQGAVIACYRERGAELSGSIGRILGELGVSAEPAALEWLAQRLGEDRMLLRRELEKLALFVGQGGRVTPEDAVACVAEGSALDLEEALMAALSGEVAVADKALDTAFAEGANAVQVVRAALRHVQRLYQASLAVAAGAEPRQAVEALRPPVFFRHKPAVERALRLWRSSALEAAGNALLEAERRTKTTSIPAEVVARNAVVGLARQAAARR
ncbi:DNA polymerase III subunit delta [Siccirubricoccus sp. KC 17139]|uniref:DNA-directed DNA polymerase n=1 Tax=Siccirubricoccus soli TaxID=2899147 RepID=A0ABT1D0V9_9PROT|nr:DNA polymerase III subunit delta [Siccirubricoccus soli]MCO6415292.1 DNA polymerase III subunit delta [Siccirubricoccus soli]MCP2681423.1 DNA polymerase III subunit delta [Siccirubricoccus soli]